MAKDDSLFSSFNEATKQNIYVADDYALYIVGEDDILCQHRKFSNTYHFPSLSEKNLSVSQLTQTSKIVEFWPNRFVVKNMNNEGLNFTKGFLNSKGGLDTFFDLS